jgi:membrane metallo-endopeptidase-like protein 1
MDHAADPCVDFFQYACGTWNKKHVIPEDRSSISTFEVMADQLQVILKGVLEEPVNLEDNEATRKAKTFYNTCMDIRKSLRTLGLFLLFLSGKFTCTTASSGNIIFGNTALKFSL